MRFSILLLIVGRKESWEREGNEMRLYRDQLFRSILRVVVDHKTIGWITSRHGLWVFRPFDNDGAQAIDSDLRKLCSFIREVTRHPMGV
jgi:hypothetical protein